jgi:phosphoglycolate phosphatase
MIDIKNYKHVIWDWNGTLFNDVEMCCDIMRGILKRRNLPEISLDTYRRIFTFPVKEYYKSAGLDVSGENWEILSHEFMDQYEIRKNECVLYEQAVEVLDDIAALGIKQSLLSAYSQHTLEEIVDHFNLSKYFTRLVGIDNIYAAGKIEQGINLMRQLEHNDGEVLLIGDTVHDYEVAREIGADCLLIAEGHQQKSSLLQVNDNVVDNLGQLASAK